MRIFSIPTSAIIVATIFLPFSAVYAQSELEQLRRVVLDQEQRIQELQEEIRRLRGDMEVVNHQHSQFATRQRNLFADLDRRLAAIEAGGQYGNVVAPEQPQIVYPEGGIDTNNPTASPSTPQTPGQESNTIANPYPDGLPPPPAEAVDPNERAAYQDAFNALQGGRYQQAIQLFSQFLQDYPGGEYADNAQYWLSESYYALRNFQTALQAYNTLLETFPNSQKRSHALLKIGYIYDELKDKVAARQVLENVVAHYPNTAVARLAEERLRRLRIEGY